MVASLAVPAAAESNAGDKVRAPRAVSAVATTAKAAAPRETVKRKSAVAKAPNVPANALDRPERAEADRGIRNRGSLWARRKSRAPGQETVRHVAGKTTAQSTGLTPPEEVDAQGVPEPLTPTVADPLEPVNRVTFALNEGLDLAVFRPVSFVYRTTVHSSVRVAISNAVHNFYSPVYFANDLLQGRPGRAGKTLMRFLINSTVGFGGLADAAAAGGLERHSEDFGQTLGVWGFGPGIYIVLPIIGPSTTRDGVGRIVDIGLNPATWLMWDLSLPERLSPTMANAVTGHEELMDEVDAIRKNSPDFYASMRDLYIQKRASDIANGAETLEPIEPEPNR